MDRITGDDTLGSNGTDGADMAVGWVYDMVVWPFVKWPFLWFLINIVWLVIFSILLKRLMKYLQDRQVGAASLKNPQS